ncbi:MAG: tetratricopeptide repeat protein [Saprospiraceae bacterium]|nr:tetratricopeptide repeat protein [Saprospiraceae bacterium]
MKSICSGILVSLIAVLGLNAQTVQEGLRHLENENFKSAMEVFDKLITTQPKVYIHHYYKAEVFTAMGNIQDAKSSYLKGLEISSKCDECLVGLGKLELNKNKHQEAIKNLESALKGNSKNASIQALVGKAYLYIDKPQAETALTYLEKARDLDPKQAKYWIYLGDAYQLKGDLGQAMTSFETAVEKDKNDPETYVKMARIWADGKNLDLAIERLETATKLNPGYAIAYKELYEMYIRARKFDKVIPILDKYVELSGTDVDAKVRLVKFLCFQAKDYTRAITEANKVLEKILNNTHFTVG